MGFITIDHCQYIGGHCFPETPAGQVPGQPVFLFLCKHCGFPQHRAYRNPWVPIISAEIESSEYEKDTEEHLGGV